MDFNKVIVMEVKDDYAIAMTSDFEFIKVKKKKSIKEGQQIYILDEDIYENGQKISFFKKNKLLKILGLMAILLGILLLMILFNSSQKALHSEDTYATVFLESASTVELKLDENKKVIDIISKDNLISNKELNSLLEESFEEVIDELDDYVENNNYVIASCYISSEENINYISSIKMEINDELSDVIFIEADKNDFKQAKKQNKTLGQYKIENITSLSELERYIDDVDYNRLEKFVLANNTSIKNIEKIIEQIKIKKMNDENYNQDDD